jgi:hypothetical protein
MSEQTVFHQHGHHVQKAHGHRSATLATDGSHTSGCMIALVPSAKDAKRLAIKGGEAVSELHLTLAYLGPDATAWNDHARGELTGFLTSMILSGDFGDWAIFTASIFGAAHWNAGGEDPSWVWSVGDTPGDDSLDHDGDALEDYHDLVYEALESGHDHPDLPPPHSPWVAHICAAYTDDLSLLPEMEQRLGEVTFDRIRVSFGDDDTLIPLNRDVGVTASAAGGLRRRPTEAETASRVDFAAQDAQWDAAVSSLTGAWGAVLSAQRAELRTQVTAAVDSGKLSRLSRLTVNTDQAVTVLTEHMTRFAQQSAERQQREAEAQGVDVPDWDLGKALTAAATGSATARIDSIARVTAQRMGARLAGAYSGRAVVLSQTDSSGNSVASRIDLELSGPVPAYAREDLASSVTAAQNFGRITVLRVAPAGSYYASEMLDNNTCKPCSAIDGQQFGSLNEADAAYPAGGYVSCAGGGRCRGELITVWGSGETASGSPKTGDVSMTTELGGKPTKGTKKDKRLEENDLADEETVEAEVTNEHFGSASGSVSNAPWDGAASRFSDEQYKMATAACDPGSGPPKTLCFLPHHEPGGATNKNGVHAAAQRVSSLKGHDPAAVARAKAHLRSHYGQIGEDVPDSIKATIEDEVELAMAARTGIESVENFDLPPEDDKNANTAPWKGPLAIEGKVTGDGREFAKESLTWADPPLTLRWNKEDSHGGEPHTVAVNVGRIDKVYREGDLIMGEGVIDLGTEDGRTVHDKVKREMLRGVSIDADSISDADVELVWPKDTNAGGDDEDDDLFAMLFAQPEKIIFHAGRIRAATLVDIPAFAEAYIALTDPEGAVVAGGKLAGADGTVQVRETAPERPVDGLLASASVREADWVPPLAWFQDPQLSVPTGITVTDDGRVYGHAAMWGSCHIGNPDVCVSPPQEETHPYFMTGEAVTDKGRVAVGQITVGTGHAPLSYGHQPAAEHYDNTGSAVADVAVGNDAHGIWVAGSIRPGADPLLVHELRASGQVSGDWRRIGSHLRMVGLLAVNVPGFPVPKMQARVASGQQQALVAAGRPTIAHSKTEEETIQQAFRTVMNMLFQRVHGGGE